MSRNLYVTTREGADCWCIRGADFHPVAADRGRLFAVVCEAVEARPVIDRLVRGERFRVDDVAVRE